MADPRSVIVVDSAGAPLTSGTPSVQAFDRTTGAARTAPTIAHVAAAPGTWRFTCSDADETTGTVVLVDFGAGNLPRFVSWECCKADQSNQFWSFPIVNASGAAWAGAAPTFGGYTGGVTPTLTAIAGAATALHVAAPSAADIAAGAEGRVDGPAGSAQPYWNVSTEPASPWAAASPGALKDAAADIAAFLDTKTAGGVVLALATNLFRGRMLSIDTSQAPAVFCLNTGGPPPDQYLGGHRKALYRAMVQVMVRGPAGDDHAGELIAREVLAWLNMQVVSGYVSWNCRDSAPAYLGVDRDQHGQWSINVECLSVAALS